MTELLQNASLRWVGYKGSGKIVALLLAVLLFWWFAEKEKKQRALLLYTTVAAACCIVPVTAAFLMLYQTKFYDYEWIWSMVPVTAVTAYGLTLFLAGHWKEAQGNWRRGLPVTLLLLMAMLFCGDLGGDMEARAETNAEKDEAYEVVGMLSERWSREDICLLAPQRILEYAREADGRLRLAYGRNMWDPWLNAYAYDTYDGKAEDLCQWMAWAEQASWIWMPEADKEEMLDTLEKQVETAVEMGVNCLLLPAGIPSDMSERIEKAMGAEVQTLGDYVAFTLF
ncbi:hypothetical protein [Acetatifactor aquisgranensis]|uniref:hypothetical protein n=1 Tax=Acetatifactor aquisgranensis TaxID=2941233 RepID=UPI00203E8ADC|nr:hypothetical protein [Acetatifactor aquisgranensis]